MFPLKTTLLSDDIGEHVGFVLYTSLVPRLLPSFMSHTEPGNEAILYYVL